ncbi:MAG TPA: hypothetical protein VF458_08880 [Ktedonobacteraceae bacterium]
MRQNAQDIDGRPVKLAERLKKGKRSNTAPCARLARSRLAVSLLAFFLLGLVVSIPLAAVREVHAQSDCILLCPPSATPSPRQTPTPTPTPKPSPTAKPTPVPTATATAKPTAQASASPEPTVAITEVGQTPVVISGHVPSTSQQGNGSQPGSNGVLLVSVIAVFVVFVLLLALGGGWLLIRRALVPPIDAKLPPSGARPWSRFRIPNPQSLLPTTNTPPAPEHEANLPIRTSTTHDFQEKTLVSNVSGGVGHSPWPLVAGDAPGAPGNFKRKKRGLITRAPYYADLASSNDEKASF